MPYYNVTLHEQWWFEKADGDVQAITQVMAGELDLGNLFDRAVVEEIERSEFCEFTDDEECPED
jgi:hypothetical protein